jgi:hypothetical protein
LILEVAPGLSYRLLKVGLNAVEYYRVMDGENEPAWSLGEAMIVRKLTARLSPKKSQTPWAATVACMPDSDPPADRVMGILVGRNHRGGSSQRTSLTTVSVERRP